MRTVEKLEDALAQAAWIIHRLYDGGSWATMEVQKPGINDTMRLIDKIAEEKGVDPHEY